MLIGNHPRRVRMREVGIEHEIGAQHGGDRAAGAEVGYLRVGRGAEEQGHRGLQHHRGESAGKVKEQIAQPPECVLDVLAEDRQKQHVAQDVVPAGMHEHGRDPSDTPRDAQVAGVVDVARVERRLVDRRLPVGQFVEQKDREVGDDQRDIDDREPAGRNAIGVRDHASPCREPSPAQVAARAAISAGDRRGPPPSARPAPTAAPSAPSVPLDQRIVARAPPGRLTVRTTYGPQAVIANSNGAFALSLTTIDICPPSDTLARVRGPRCWSRPTIEEHLMADNRLSEKFDALSDKAKESANKLKASAGREKDQLKADAAAARERATATADRFEEKVVDASVRASSQWDEVRGKWKAHLAKVRSDLDAKKDEHDAKAAARDADDAEGYALDAISFAQGAIEEAEAASLTLSTPGPTRWRSAPEVLGHDCPRAAKAVARPVEMDAGLRGAGGDPGRLCAGMAGISILVAAILFGVCLPITGIAQVIFAFALDVSAGSRILLFISGAASLILAVLAFRHFGKDQTTAVLLLAI